MISAPGQPYPGSNATGVVVEYDLAQPGWVTQPSVLALPAGSTTTRFGRSLDLDAGRLAIGADDEAFEYRRQAGIWQRFARVVPPSQGDICPKNSGSTVSPEHHPRSCSIRAR